MNVDDLLRDTLREQAAEQPPAGPGFADWVLAVRRRRRTRRMVTVVAATVAVVAVAVGVPLLDSGKSDVRPSGVVDGDKVSAQPSQSPPRELIAAGNTALAAYYIPTTVKKSATETDSERTYWLLDPKTGTYVKAPKWSFVAVAPGLKTAAVLERTLPAPRIGLLDLTTGEVKRWIQVGHKVGGLAFSADGRKLVATTYTQNPDADFHPADPNAGEPERLSSRTGFYVLDVASGKGTWAGVAVGGQRADGLSTFVNNRQDFAPTPDGRYVWAGGIASDDVNKLFYDPTGAEVPAPENGSKYLLSYVDAGMSPDGKRVAGDFAGQKWTTSSYVVDSATGARTEVHGQQLLAWADDRSLIAWDVGKGDGEGKSEFHQRLVLITIGSDKEVPLSGFRKGTDVSAGRWQPVFARR
ncbi:WD40 repeat domain-containing protein [Streptomyces sp. MBT65]|uniref:WD40 repeat domain-containing protein n=1 Tax=Streptomyces sp. MBT65 TaxID=1488395 RepID=UPI00190B8B75|nr:WD40 repeat domain-containing protein [Streptomyces sp. MBT65]MBK3581506.1 WD40 repeat domain-containing protein [Streptomyces sp. MBT65]